LQLQTKNSGGQPQGGGRGIRSTPTTHLCDSPDGKNAFGRSVAVTLGRHVTGPASVRTMLGSARQGIESRHKKGPSFGLAVEYRICATDMSYAQSRYAQLKRKYAELRRRKEAREELYEEKASSIVTSTRKHYCQDQEGQDDQPPTCEIWLSRQ
jgi:hypothetical protein